MRQVAQQPTDTGRRDHRTATAEAGVAGLLNFILNNLKLADCRWGA